MQEKNAFKRLQALLLSFVLMLTLMPIQVHADEYDDPADEQLVEGYNALFPDDDMDDAAAPDAVAFALPEPYAINEVTVSNFGELQTAIETTFAAATDDMTIIVTADILITAFLTIPANSNGVTLTITSASQSDIKTLTRAVNDALFTVNSNAKLTLENIIIDGNKTNVSNAIGSLVRVNGGIFNMNTGTTLQNNVNTTGNGGGVYVAGGSGIFNMNGGKISGNIATNGGGVFVAGGTFNMYGGTISGNTATNGGGVYSNASINPLNIGDTAVIKGNKKSDNATNNVYLPSGKTITLGTGSNAPTTGMEVWVKLESGSVIVNSASGFGSGKLLLCRQSGAGRGV